MSDPGWPGDPAALAADVFGTEPEDLPDAHARDSLTENETTLPGVGGDDVSLRSAFGIGGRATIVVVGLLTMVAELDTIALGVLAPDIQESLGISDSVLGVITAAFGVFFLLGSVPISTLADRLPRTKVAAVGAAAWSLVMVATSAVVNGFQLFLTRMAAGLGHSYQIPVTGPLLMDAYPIEARARIFAVNGTFQAAGTAIGPVFAGALAGAVGGPDGWRWVFVVIGAVSAPLVLAAWRLPEPRRGRHEMRAVVGTEIEEDEDEPPISLGVAFARLNKIRSFHYFLMGVASLGFALFATGIFVNLFFERQFGLDAFERGVVASLTALPAVAAILTVGRRADERFQQSPPLAFALIGGLIALYGALQVTALWMPALWLVVVALGASAACSRSAFAVLPAVLSTVIPYRLRSRGSALVGIYLFLFGAFFGSIITGLLSDAFGTRTALTIVILPSTTIGGVLIALGARHVTRDMQLVVEELTEENEEQTRRANTAADVPVLQIRNLDFSYGRVQVLFDVGFEVAAGEAVALLGTNGAGKSTVMRAVSGLGVPDRGVVRLHGKTVTYADATLRAKLGIVQLAGGHAIFPPLTVRENLDMAAYRYSTSERSTRIESSLTRLPALRDRLTETAGSLSGGQQQMLALAMALLHDPEILLIDELSLGLAPQIVQELLETVAQLRADGQAMLIVEQSLNVAAAIADRAVFMEKGRIRFEGPIAELVRREDLARAVFLGTDGR